MKHSIEVTETNPGAERGGEYSAVIYPNPSNSTWDIVIERWVARPYEGTTVYPQEQIYRERIPNTGSDGIIEHLEALGWSVPAMSEWRTAIHTAVQSAYVIELGAPPQLPVIYRQRPVDQRWLIVECLLRGVPSDFTVQMIDSGVRTIEEVYSAFDAEKVVRAVL